MATKKGEGRKMKKMVVGLLAAAMLLVGAQAHATPYVFLADTNSSASVLVYDGGSGDINSAVGVITVSVDLTDPMNPTDPGWTINVTTGITDPVLTGKMDLNSVNVSSDLQAPSTLYVGFFDDQGFVPGSMTIGGTTSGSVVYNAWVMDTAMVWQTVGTLGPFGSGAFSGEGSVAGFAGLANFQQVLITHGAGTNSTSFNAELKRVPEPGTMLLLGSGLLGLGLMRRRRQVR